MIATSKKWINLIASSPSELDAIVDEFKKQYPNDDWQYEKEPHGIILEFMEDGKLVKKRKFVTTLYSTNV